MLIGHLEEEHEVNLLDAIVVAYAIVAQHCGVIPNTLDKLKSLEIHKAGGFRLNFFSVERGIEKKKAPY